MAALIRAHDWSQCSVGEMRDWPGPLRAAVNTIVNSPESMYLAWGPELTFFFNDTYVPILGSRFERALGADLRVLWADSWDAVSGPIEAAFRGESGRFVDVPIEMARHGVPEATWWTFSFSPIYLESGEVGGALCITSEVTGKVRTEQHLAQEHLRLAQLFEQAPMFMAFLNGADHRIEVVNPGYSALIDHREVVGKTVAEALPDAVSQGYLGLLDHVFQTGLAYASNSSPYMVQASPESPIHERYVDFVYQPIKDTDGAVSGIFVQGVDVTERTLNEANLRIADDRNRQILSSATDYAIVATDLSGHVTRWNAGAQLIFGWQEHELLGKRLDLIFAEDAMPGRLLDQNIDQALRNDRTSGERWYVRRGGERFWANASTTVLRDESGKASGLVMVLRDKTEERAASEALRDSEQRLAALVHASSDAMYSMNADWSEMRQLTRDGEPEGAWRPTTYWIQRYLPAEDHAEVQRRIAAAVARAEPLSLEHRIERSEGGTGWYQSRAVPLFDAAGALRGWFGAASDISQRRQAELDLQQLTASLEERVRERTAELQLAEDKLRHSQKMEAVGQLTGGLAHDFNNLLAAVSMGLELMQQRIAEGRHDKLDRYLDIARAGTDRAAALTQRLLAFSRRQTLAPASIDVDQLVFGMEDIIRRTLGPAINVRIQPTQAPWLVLADVSQLENALLNLCINARDALPHGGQLRIRTDNLSLTTAAAQALEVQPGDYVRLIVQDNGTGMSEDIKDKVFEPFFTTKPIGQGTGLGLSMIYGFMRQSGGQASIESAPGVGTTMSLYLPRSQRNDTGGTLSEAPARSGGTQASTILLVEDETPVRLLMAEILGAAGHHVIDAADGPAAVEKLQGAQHLDLLVTDVGLPGGLNGRQVADAGRLVRPHLPVLFVTGYAANAAVGADELEAGMEVMRKPFQADELEQRVGAILQRQRLQA